MDSVPVQPVRELRPFRPVSKPRVNGTKKVSYKTL